MSPAVVRASSKATWKEIALAFVAAPVGLPPMWVLGRLIVDVLDWSDPTVAAPALAGLAWVVGLITLALVAWRRWQRPAFAAGLVLSLLMWIFLGGIAAFAMAAAMGSGIRG